MIRPVVHNKSGVLWCGPAALSAITGFGTAEIHRVLEAVTHRKSIKAVGTWEFHETARRLGCEIAPVLELRGNPDFFDKKTRPTLVQFAREHREILKHHAIVVALTSHYVVLSGRRFVDSHEPTPIHFLKAPHRRARVESAWIITPGVRPAQIPPAPEPVKRDYSLAKAKRIAAAWGITVELHNPGEHWVYPPDDSRLHGRRDPYYDEHLGYDDADVLKRVETYAKLLANNL